MEEWKEEGEKELKITKGKRTKLRKKERIEKKTERNKKGLRKNKERREGILKKRRKGMELKEN